MRHADAGDADPRCWPDDRDRPLTDAGRREHARVAARARETAAITARTFGDRPAPEPTDLLGDRAHPASILVGLSRVTADTLLCVGHEPTLSGLIAVRTSRDGNARVAMAKSGVALRECADRAGRGPGRAADASAAGRDRPPRRRGGGPARPGRAVAGRVHGGAAPRISAAPRSRARSTWTCSPPSAGATRRRRRWPRGMAPRRGAPGSSATT
jgi:phosphohistidine phosphatase SixA